MGGIGAARALRLRERHARIMLGFNRRHFRARIFVLLQMRFGSLDRRLRRGEIVGSARWRTRRTRRLDRLARIAHFLDRRTGTGHQEGQERKYCKTA